MPRNPQAATCVNAAMLNGHESTLVAAVAVDQLRDVSDELICGKRQKEILRVVRQFKAEGRRPSCLDLCDQLEADKRIDKAGGRSFVTDVFGMPGTSKDAVDFALSQTREADAIRKAAKIGKKLADGSMDIRGAVAELETLSPNGDIDAVALSDLVTPGQNDPKELLRHRFLCRGAGMLIAGPTGIGKSAFAMQCKINWALGLACFGIEPARPLRSLLIQAENDEGDLAEMRDGVLAGLKLDRDDMAKIAGAIHMYCEDGLSGPEFFSAVVEPALRKYKPDLLWIDPAFAYSGAENNNSSTDIGKFLRAGLNPLIHRHGCAAIILHHTTKPSTSKDKTELAGSNLAYLGAGSIEWSNWPRAIIGLQAQGNHEVYKLVLAKRGARVGWRTDDGDRLFHRYIAHSTEPGVICWIESTEEEAKARSGKGAPKQFTVDHLKVVLREYPKGLTTTEWLHECMNETGMSKATFHNLKLDIGGAVERTPDRRWKLVA